MLTSALGFDSTNGSIIFNGSMSHVDHRRDIRRHQRKGPQAQQGSTARSTCWKHALFVLQVLATDKSDNKHKYNEAAKSAASG